MTTIRIARAKPVTISVIGLVIIFGLLYAWRASRSGNGGYPAVPPIPVSTALVKSQKVAGELQAVGSLESVREVLLAPDTSGRITAINFNAGQFVKKGTVLVQLYDAPEQADRAAAAAKADFAQLQLRRSQELATTGAESRELLEQHKAEAAQAIAAVRQLDARIQQKAVRAPFSGQIGIRRVNLGQYLNAGDGIATLTQLDPLYVNFTLPQQDLPKVAEGASVQVTVDAAPSQVFTAKVNSIEPRVNGETRNAVVQALLPNPERLLKSGMYATARLELPAQTDAIVVPLTAIQTSASGDGAIIVQDADAKGVGKAVAVPVITGRRLGEDILVTQGIKPGDILVTAGQNRLPPGATVKISTAAPPGKPTGEPAAVSTTAIAR
ncbi:efflux RND transporter periplasmic adaptor subunit [Burkholderia cenocepacia]|uniref:efflux RND transporter periplasmic adaptor subunit n=1 Tax=Burkholderia cenocepacia TaxID=95486 RepID=UPI000F5BA8A8|nr:efflux RND transporter periplasmic adaptor subunit [Burkholderia cenocepacia]RQV08979.1 efflux RND transporter periplasmic adaptor subunit [Burkholderia cenocepacia]